MYPAPVCSCYFVYRPSSVHYIKTEDCIGWSDKDGLYCKSYCPLHPDVHKVVFALIGEIIDAFDTDLFRAGMDEVFYIGNDNCPRCSGRDKEVRQCFSESVRGKNNSLKII
jgi:hypothetical protein